MRIYMVANGWDKWLDEYNINNKLYSAYYCMYKYHPVVKPNNSIMIDSGGFTARTSGVEASVVDYANFINGLDKRIKLIFNLDTNDVEETLYNQKYLEEHTNRYIMPIYHHSDFMDKKYRYLLQYYIDNGYYYIGLGGVAGGVNVTTEQREQFFKYCFSKTHDKVRLHGLGVSGMYYLKKYPFYSVDSSTWLAFTKFGEFELFRGMDKVRGRPVKNYNKFKECSKEEVIGTNGDKQARLKITMETFLRTEKFLTDLWAKRGVVWDD